MPPCQRKVEARDKPSDPHTRAWHPPECYCDGSDPVCQTDNLPVPAAAAPRPTVRQMQHCQSVDSEQDAEFIDINDHLEVDEDDVDETGVVNETEAVKWPIPWAHAPWGPALPSPMNMVNSIDPLDSSGGKGAWDVNYFFDRNAEGATCWICKLVFLLPSYLLILWVIVAGHKKNSIQSNSPWAERFITRPRLLLLRFTVTLKAFIFWSL